MNGNVGTNATGTEAPGAGPPDKDAKALVAAIHKQAADPAGVSIFQLWTRLSVIQGNAERLAVLLDERDAAREELVTAAERLLRDVQEYEAWQRPCYAVTELTAALARVKGEK
jgi:hypothetical protein